MGTFSLLGCSLGAKGREAQGVVGIRRAKAAGTTAWEVGGVMVWAGLPAWGGGHSTPPSPRLVCPGAESRIDSSIWEEHCSRGAVATSATRPRGEGGCARVQLFGWFVWCPGWDTNPRALAEGARPYLDPCLTAPPTGSQSSTALDVWRLMNTVSHTVETLECLRHRIPIPRSPRGPPPGLAFLWREEALQIRAQPGPGRCHPSG